MITELDPDLASERNASYSYAFYIRGLLHYSEGQNKEAYESYYFGLAAADFRQALKLDPSNTLAQSALAKIESR